MARYVTTIRSARSQTDVFDFMADLRNFEQWDPGVRKVTQITGDGGGTDADFDVVIDAPRGGLTLRYHTPIHEPPNRVVVKARSKLFTSIDTITVEADDQGSIVTYDATLSLNGALGIFDLVLRPVFGRIGDRANIGLLKALDGKPA